MRKVGVLAVLVTALFAAVPGTAHAEVEPRGFGCGFAFMRDPTDPTERRQIGEIDGGPLVIDDGSGNPLTASLTCSIQTSSLHSAPDLARETSLTTPGAMVLEPTRIGFELEPFDWVWWCMQVNVQGGPVLYYAPYWDPDNPWTTNPDAPCQTNIGSPPPDPWLPVDQIICPLFTVLFPPEGDIPELWNCPPYHE